MYLYPLWIRLWHFFNALAILILIITGLSMQYSNPDYPLISFDTAVILHNIAGISVCILYLIFITGNIITPNGNYYKIKFKGLGKRCLNQFTYYTSGVFKKQAPPFPINKEQKFNPLQKITYVIVMYILVPLVILTGIALLFPEMIFPQIWGENGIYITALSHSIIGFILSLFLVIHIYFSTFGASPASNFKAIASGWQQKH